MKLDCCKNANNCHNSNNPVPTFMNCARILNLLDGVLLLPTELCNLN